MEDYITVAEHKEYAKRVEAEDTRQNKRLDTLETNISEMMTVQSDIRAINANIEQILKTLEKEETRLDTLESRDGDMWRTVVKYAITAIVAASVGFAFAQIGLL